MTGKIKSHFPKPGKPGTWIVVVTPSDNSPDIYEEMNGVADKSELPKVGQTVELVTGWPTWMVK